MNSMYLTIYLKFKARYTLKLKYMIRQLLINHYQKRKKRSTVEIIKVLLKKN